MNEPGSQPVNEQLERQLRRAARHLPYPPTPDLAAGVRRPAKPAVPPARRLAWVALGLIVVAALLFTVPPVRAALLEALRLGAVRIFLSQPTPTVPPTATPISSGPIDPGRPPTVTPVPSPAPLFSLLDLAGETTLAEAQAQVDFPIRLPAEPPDLGLPDRVFVQDFDGPLVILLWLAPGDPNQIRLSLHLLGPNVFAGKGAPQVVEETTVHGRPALWLEGPHLLQLRGGGYELKRLVEGNILVWVEGKITYRLETDLPLDEAISVAESLQPLRDAEQR